MRAYNIFHLLPGFLNRDYSSVRVLIGNEWKEQ